MMMPKTKQRAARAGKKCWSESFCVYGAKIRIAEREPGGVLYLLWLDNKGKQQKRSLHHRDRREGRKQALELANAMATASATGARVVDGQSCTGVEEEEEAENSFSSAPSASSA
jgi:cation transport regulator ChaC